jgi:transglutaminase-like putative cysteine protease
MRVLGVVLAVSVVLTGAVAGPKPAGAPFEIVKDHVEIEVAPDSTDVSSRELVMRALDERGIAALHEQRIGIAGTYENVQVASAYTLKANGQKIQVPPSGYLRGYGQTSQPGFQDNGILSIFFPNLEVGDSIVLLTIHRQIKPWFDDRFDTRINFSRRVPAHDVSIAVTAPLSMALKFDDMGLTAGPSQTMGSKIRRVWSFSNDAVEPPETDAVGESDFAPRLIVTSFADYADVARAYRDRSKSTSDVTPEISALADQVTAGITDRREQTKRLYDWVSSHIAYVGIVLGAGGFTPHPAKSVLSNRYGDCKDHVVLLEALLKAKGIASDPVLIQIGEATFERSAAAMPHAFDHVITYVPEFGLYLDSTAQFAPFGVLPYPDAGKPVLNVSTGLIARTPVTVVETSTMKSVGEVRFDKDGSADADVTITATGAIGTEIRQGVRGIEPGGEQKFISDRVGPGVQGTLERGDPAALVEPYVLKAHYSLPNAIVLPGPGALPPSLAFRVVSFSLLLANDLPPQRRHAYVCSSLAVSQQIRYVFPPGFRLLSIPEPSDLNAEGVRLHVAFDRVDGHTLLFKADLRVSHPEAFCTPAYYAKARPALAKMLNALKEQVLYRAPKDNGQ